LRYKFSHEFLDCEVKAMAGDAAGAGQDIDALKAAARKAARARRAAALAATPDAGPRLAARFIAAVEPAVGQVVSVFWPLAGEIDTLPLMTALSERGCQVALPAMQGAGLPLIFRCWQPGDSLVPAGFGTQEPAAEKALADPSLLAVPLLAFDRAGYRLGYGGGFYDRTLARLRAAAPRRSVGIALAAQEVPAVPRGPHDERLDYIVTEAEAFAVTARKVETA